MVSCSAGPFPSSQTHIFPLLIKRIFRGYWRPETLRGSAEESRQTIRVEVGVATRVTVRLGVGVGVGDGNVRPAEEGEAAGRLVDPGIYLSCFGASSGSSLSLQLTVRRNMIIMMILLIQFIPKPIPSSFL